MSKRVGNNKKVGLHSPARYGRVRIGFHKRRMLDMLSKTEEQLAMGKLDEKAKAKFADFKANLRKLIPARLLNRYQSR